MSTEIGLINCKGVRLGVFVFHHVWEMVRSGGRAVERRTVNRGDGGSIPPTAVSKQFPHLPVSFGRESKSRWSLLSGVYARGSKRSHTGGKCVTCSGLTNSREELLRYPRFWPLEETT